MRKQELLNSFWFILLWLGYAPFTLAQIEMEEVYLNQFSEASVQELQDLNAVARFQIDRFDWVSWQSTGLFSELALHGIKERVSRLGEMGHWLELQSIHGVDTFMLAQLLNRFPTLSRLNSGKEMLDQEVSLLSMQRHQFPILNRYHSRDSSKIPEGQPWSQRIKLNWRSSNFTARVSLEKDMGERLIPVDHYSWTISKQGILKKTHYEVTIGEFRPFFGIGYLHGLRGGRMNSIWGSWTEAYDSKIKPMAGSTENTNPQGIAFQVKQGSWTVSSFFSIRQWAFTDSNEIDFIHTQLYSSKPKLSGLHRTVNEQIQSSGTEYWSAVNVLFQKRTWAFGLMLSHENWTQSGMLKNSWITLSGYCRKSYAGGHFQTEFLGNSTQQMGIKTDWIQWLGSQATILMKSQLTLNQPFVNELSRLTQWRNPSVNEQYIQLIYQLKLNSSYQFYQQVWQDWRESIAANQTGFGWGIQWQSGKTAQMLLEFRWSKATSQLALQSQWTIAKGKILKTIWRINPTTASMANNIQYVWAPESSKVKLKLQFSGFKLHEGILPVIEPDLEFPYRMFIASGAGSRLHFQMKYKIPPYLSIGWYGTVTHKSGQNPWGTGLDGRIGNFLYEIGFSVEIRLKNQSQTQD